MELVKAVGTGGTAQIRSGVARYCQNIAYTQEICNPDGVIAEQISVEEAAAMLKVSPQQVRVHLANGRLRGAKLSGRWLVDRESVERMRISRAGPGRPLDPENAWGLLWLLSGRHPSWVKPWTMSRLRQRTSVEDLVVSTATRAERRTFRTHSGLIQHLRNDHRLVLTGISASRHYRADVVGRREVEAYVSERNLPGVANDHKLSEMADDPNVVLRVVKGFWPFESGERYAPRAVVAVDLLDSTDERSRRAGSKLLRGPRP